MHQAGAPPDGRARVAETLGRMGPGDHGVAFGPSEPHATLVEALLARAGALGFHLLIAHRAMPADTLGEAVARSPAGAAALAAGRLSLLPRDGAAGLLRAAARAGPAAFEPLVAAARAGGARGLYVCLMGPFEGGEAAEAEAALHGRLEPGLVLHCVYPGPPSDLAEALRVLRAHTPGRLSMPAVWRRASEGVAGPPPAAATPRS